MAASVCPVRTSSHHSASAASCHVNEDLGIIRSSHFFQKKLKIQIFMHIILIFKCWKIVQLFKTTLHMLMQSIFFSFEFLWLPDLSQREVLEYTVEEKKTD